MEFKGNFVFHYISVELDFFYISLIHIEIKDMFFLLYIVIFRKYLLTFFFVVKAFSNQTN